MQSDYESRLVPVLCDWADHRYPAAIGRERLNGRERPSLANCTHREMMTTASNSSATLLLVTGLLSVSMAAMGYYYLHMSSKKPLDTEAAGVHNGEKSPAACPFSRGLAEEEKHSGAKCPVTGMLASFTGGGEDAKEKETTAFVEEQKTEPASLKKKVESLKTEQEVVETPVKVVEAPVAVEKVATSPKKEVAASPKKEVAASPKKEVVASPKKEVVASPKKEVVASPKKEVVASPSMEVAASPKKTPKSSPKETVESPKKETEPPVLELPKPAHSSPKKSVESPKKETHPIVTDSPKQVATSSKKTPESPKKSLESPKKVAVSVARKLSEDFVITQAVSETASAFAEDLVQESLENITLEQEEYVEVELTQSMTLSQSTPELINIEDAAVANVEEDISRSAATEDEESIVEEEQDQVPVESVEPVSAEPVVEAPAASAAVASPKGPRATSTSWEAITSSPVVKKATPAEKPAPALSLDTPAENAETEEPLSISVPTENSEVPAADDKDGASSPVSSGGSSPGRRNRNRSKKSKSKKKKGKKKLKA